MTEIKIKEKCLACNQVIVRTYPYPGGACLSDRHLKINGAKFDPMRIKKDCENKITIKKIQKSVLESIGIFPLKFI